MTTPVPSVGGIPLDFLLFAAVLACVAIFHHHTLRVAVLGLALIAAYKSLYSPLHGVAGAAGLTALLRHEWVTIANLFALLLGFALLSKHFEESHLPALLPRFLPDDWRGGFVMLVLVYVLSSFLDNIAAAMVGGTMATVLYRGRLHIGFLAAIVAASNAGGAGSVIGDTTTMMSIAEVSPLQVFEAYIAAVPALFFFGVIAARQQQKAHQPITKDVAAGLAVDCTRLRVVAFILFAAVAANVYFDLRQPEVLERLPVIGLAVWAAIVATMYLRRPDWSLLPGAMRGSVFLLSLVLCTAMMPVETLPAPSWQTSLGIGFVSAAFDNIPLTALALRQGGYDWGVLAYAVGFGGSIIWFGSSAGVALAAMFPEARSVGAWVRGGWHVTAGYLIGFARLLSTLGWHADAPRARISNSQSAASVVFAAPR